jgi:hypothetical protein
MKSFVCLFVALAVLAAAGCASPRQYSARCTGCGEEIKSQTLVADEFQPIPGGWLEIKTARFKCRKCGTFLRPCSQAAIHQDLSATETIANGK